MSNDEMNFEDDVSTDELSDEDVSEDLYDDDPADEDLLLDEDASDDEEVGASGDDTTAGGSDEEGETEALDDLEAEELEMLTEDEASETIVVDEETQLRDIRRAQLSMESGVAGGATEGEFVCSVCFLVKKSSQIANKRKKICLDCAG
jgi:hypothetical protein